MSAVGEGAFELAVVIAVRDERAHLPTLIADLRAQTLPRSRWHLVVVDGGSADGTDRWAAGVCAEEPGWRFLRNPLGRAGPGRNRGVAATRAPYLLFLDGHCRLPSVSMLADVLRAFRAGHACLSRPQRLMPADASAEARAIAIARTLAVGHMPGSAIHADGEGTVDPKSAGCAYRRDLFLGLGGYDEGFDAAEDVELNWRVSRSGIVALHAPQFRTLHVARPDLAALARQMFRYGLGRGRLHRRWPDAIDAASALPLLGVALGAAVAVAPGAVACTFALGCLWTAVAGARHPQAERRRLSVAVLVPAALGTIAVAGSLGYVTGLLRPSAAPRRARCRTILAARER